MQTESFGLVPVSPLLFRTATPRVAGVEIPGSYDPALKVWAVDAGGLRRPIITAGEDALLDIETTTKVRQEGDDEESRASDSFGSLCEIVTKTATQQEADDDRFGSDARLGLLAEMVTKTEVQQEADDDTADPLIADQFAPSYSLPELTTKTDVQQESDDQFRTVGMDFGFSPSGRLGALVELEAKTFYEIEHDDRDPSRV